MVGEVVVSDSDTDGYKYGTLTDVTSTVSAGAEGCENSKDMGSDRRDVGVDVKATDSVALGDNSGSSDLGSDGKIEIIEGADSESALVASVEREIGSSLDRLKEDVSEEDKIDSVVDRDEDDVVPVVVVPLSQLLGGRGGTEGSGFG